MDMQVSIPKIEYSNDESKALEIINDLCSNNDCEILNSILSEIVDNVVFNQNKDIIGIILDYEYVLI